MNDGAMVLSEPEAELAQCAAEARQRAYAPYSGYAVGAALRTPSGEIFTGVNVENAAYPDSLCAERVAIVKAVSEGYREFAVIAVSTGNGGTPCGSCRQVMAEFGLEATVLIVDSRGKLLQRTTVQALLPDSFGPQQLKAQAV
jgi:cytidine deaminase